MSGYRLKPKAVEDLEAIGGFIAMDDPVRAVAFVDELSAFYARIAEHPHADRRRDDLVKGVRQAVHGRYPNLFTASGRGIVIERVVHGAQRLADLL